MTSTVFMSPSRCDGVVDAEVVCAEFSSPQGWAVFSLSAAYHCFPGIVHRLREREAEPGLHAVPPGLLDGPSVLRFAA